ncbi:hypothetical protein ACSBL2_21370 [Pedobacter sp. AW31-3R]|uniref:hypothetical protein n=1 Tax=Pedobacter sp. AW31-3R TaxID=3445781 RepID=UPI003F9F790F
MFGQTSRNILATLCLGSGIVLHWEGLTYQHPTAALSQPVRNPEHFQYLQDEHRTYAIPGQTLSYTGIKILILPTEIMTEKIFIFLLTLYDLVWLHLQRGNQAIALLPDFKS